MAAQMRNFLDQTGPLWGRGALVGKVGSVFCSTASQHGGQETTITSFHLTLLHHGMVIVGLPYTCKDLATMREITGGTPYGASCVAGGGADQRMPTALELEICQYQGEHVTRIASHLVAGRKGGRRKLLSAKQRMGSRYSCRHQSNSGIKPRAYEKKRMRRG